LRLPHDPLTVACLYCVWKQLPTSLGVHLRPHLSHKPACGWCLFVPPVPLLHHYLCTCTTEIVSV